MMKKSLGATALTVALVLSGCASVRDLPGSPQWLEAQEAAHRTEARTRGQGARANADFAGSQDEVPAAQQRLPSASELLERELASTHTDRVSIPRATLNQVLRENRARQQQCNQLSVQLEAIKRVDTEQKP